jgi:hypothetical protein
MMTAACDTGFDETLGHGMRSTCLDPAHHDGQGVDESWLGESWLQDLKPTEK